MTASDGQSSQNLLERQAREATVDHGIELGRRSRRILRPGLEGCASRDYPEGMCRNIHVLSNFEPAATDDEVHAAALQYVRKISGSAHPSKANEEAFDRAVHEISHISQHLLEDLVSAAPPKNREIEANKAKARSQKRFAAA